MPDRFHIAALVLVLLFPVFAGAEIFKCVSANGELTFSQTPCPENDSLVTVQKSAGRSSMSPADCQHAHRFALDTAREMMAGRDSSTVFDGYGGLGALSKGSVSLISYVFQFRTNGDVSAERVAALSMAKCQAKSFGDVSCEQLPAGFTARLGGCDPDDEDDGSPDVPYLVATAEQTAFRVNDNALDTAAAKRQENREIRAREEQEQRQCKARIRDRIENINSQMRSGYRGSQGDSLRQKRRDLENKLREC